MSLDALRSLQEQASLGPRMVDMMDAVCIKRGAILRVPQ